MKRGFITGPAIKSDDLRGPTLNLISSFLEVEDDGELSEVGLL